MATTESDFRSYELTVSPYERVASMLLALLALIGTAVLTMFILWLTSQIFASQEAVPVQLEEIGTGEGPLGGTQLDAPMADELGMETDLEVPTLEQTLASIADAVASQVALLDDPTLTEEMLTGRGGRTGDGRGLGFGSGPGGTGRARGWKVRFPPGNTVDTYARQLDHFGIEMGILVPDSDVGAKVVLAANFTKRVPDKAEKPTDQEERCYLTWTSGGLQEADVELLGRANISGKGQIILKFIPQELEKELIRQEQAHAGREAKDIRTTVFGVRTKGRGYEFYVMDQTYK